MTDIHSNDSLCASSAPATLATVKHGGCVQLGDGLLPCPFCGARAERIDLGPGSGDNEGGSCVACTACQSSGPVEFGYKENFISDWNRRALSAQPSSGGHGYALLREVSAQLESLDCGACIGSDAPMEDLHGRIAAHLAARQPVCATVKDSLTVGGGLPVGEPERRAPVQGYHGKTIPWRIHGMAWEVYARKYPGQDAAKIASRGGFAVEEMDAFLPGWREMSEGTPAQAVDLGPPIAMIDQALRHLSNALDDLDSSPDRRPGGMVAEAMACLRQALTGVQS